MMPSTASGSSSKKQPYIGELENAASYDAEEQARRSLKHNDESNSDDEQDIEDDDGNDDWDDWEEERAGGPTFALFSPDKQLTTPEAALEYDAKHSGVDLLEVINKLSLDFHQIIRLINYIRSSHPTPESINLLTMEDPLWTDDMWLTPVNPDDPLLQLDLEELALSRLPSTSTGPASAHPGASNAELQRRIRLLEEELASAREGLMEQRALMEKHFKVNNLGEIANGQDHDASDRPTIPRSDKGKQRDDDSHYFHSYSQNEIHEIMLKDAIRTDAYRDFILNNPSIFKDAIVLDVGCGTGILSMFAARGGAKKVFAVDASDVAYRARQNVKDNGLDNIIKVVRGKIEDLPEEELDEVDVIISEWMGYFLLYESMVDSVMHARNRFLKPDGLVVPSQCSILLAAASTPAFYQETVSYWSDVYGFQMRSMAQDVHKEAHVAVFPSDCIVSSSAVIKNVHVSLDSAKDSDFSSPFSLTISQAGSTTVHGFLGWFDTFFTTDGRLVDGSTLDKTQDSLKAKTGEVAFTTGPRGTPTHWKQTLFMFKHPIAVKQGDVISGTLYCRKRGDNSRELEVDATWRVGEDGEQSAQSWVVC